MSIVLRIALVIISLLTAFWIGTNIRRSKLKIEDSVFWLGFSALLIIISIFPQIIEWGAGVLGIQGPQNFLFLVIIFLLIIKIFKMNIKISQLEFKLQSIAQKIAIDKHDKEGK